MPKLTMNVGYFWTNYSKYTKDDFLDFISMQNKLIASDLRALEGIKD